MKKTLLTAFAVAVAFAASAVTLVNERPALTAHELNGSLAAVENVKAKAFKAPAQKAVAMSDVVGTYVMYYQDYFEDGAPTFSEVTVAAGEEDNTLIISGWWASYAEDLTATLDPDAGTITIPRQLIYQYEGDTSADLVNASDTTAAIVGTVYDGEGIVFSGYWGAKLENKTSYYVLGYNTIFFVPNGTMTWKKSNTNYSTSVYLEDDTKSVYVGNFAIGGGYGYNLVAKKWLFHLSAQPNVIIFNSNSVKMNGEKRSESLHFPEMIVNSRAAIIYNINTKYFVGTMKDEDYPEFTDMYQKIIDQAQGR